ncbi:MAG: hypothetical protein FWC93_04535 [Defluviitaleaceae bacterium]|nr:hypothetical protein [Defluviitaleaceae bacterium]
MNTTGDIYKYKHDNNVETEMPELKIICMSDVQSELVDWFEIIFAESG